VEEPGNHPQDRQPADDAPHEADGARLLEVAAGIGTSNGTASTRRPVTARELFARRGTRTAALRFPEAVGIPGSVAQPRAAERPHILRGMPDARDRRAYFAVLVAVFVASVAVAAYVIRPWIAAPLAFDTAASVLHFDRIVSGRHLEQALSTTPKPLLTLLYGLIYSATGDWRAISLAALGAWGLCVSSAAVLAWRLGGAVAAVFGVMSLLLSSRLLLETAWALGSVWALLLWIVAGLAVTARRPRWGIAGAALGLATLARLETFLVIGLALAVLAVMHFGPKRWRQPVPGEAWRISIGLLALPIMCLHDVLLTGDPFFWTSVASSYSAAAESSGRLLSLGAVARELAALALGQAAVTILAVVGTGVLAARARWPILVGLVALGPGMALFLLLLAARHTFVDQRYLVPISVAMIFAAAIGLSAVRIPDLATLLGGRLRDLGERPARDRPTAWMGAVSLAVAAIAIVGSPTIGPLDRSARATIASARHLARTADLSLPEIRAALADPAAAGSAFGGSGSGVRASTYQVFVPVPVRPRVAVDLYLSLDQVGSYRYPQTLAAGAPKTGQTILIDVDPSAPSEASAEFRLSRPATVAGVQMVPLLSDPADGAWLLQVAAP